MNEIKVRSLFLHVIGGIQSVPKFDEVRCEYSTTSYFCIENYGHNAFMPSRNTGGFILIRSRILVHTFKDNEGIAMKLLTDLYWFVRSKRMKQVLNILILIFSEIINGKKS